MGLYRGCLAFIVGRPYRRVCLVTVALLFLLADFSWAEVCKGSKVPKAALTGHIGSISEVENLTGVDLLPKLDGEALKRAVASELWPRD